MTVKDLKEYELTLLMTTEEKNSPQDDRIRSIFLIKNKEEDGWKTLAYPITEDGKTYEKGYFVYYDLLQREDIESYFLTRLFDQDKTVLRYLLVNKSLSNNKRKD